MTVKDIALTAAAVLQAEDTERLISSDADDAMTDADVRTLVKCVNLAIKEACADGFPVCVTRELRAERGMIPYADFDPQPSVIRRVARYGVPAVNSSVGFSHPGNHF